MHHKQEDGGTSHRRGRRDPTKKSSPPPSPLPPQAVAGRERASIPDSSHLNYKLKDSRSSSEGERGTCSSNFQPRSNNRYFFLSGEKPVKKKEWRVLFRKDPDCSFAVVTFLSGVKLAQKKVLGIMQIASKNELISPPK